MKISIVTILLAFLFQYSFSQFNNIHGFAETGILYGTRDRIPFWMLTDQYGRFTPRSGNGYLRAGIFSDSIKQDRKFGLDWGAEVFGRYDGTLKGWLHQGYAGGKVWFLYFYAGLKEEHFGSQDHEMSSGFVMWSGNARPIPQISLSTFDFVPIPFTNGFLELKGGISHGWFGMDGYVKHAYLHHKYLYLRFGGLHPFHLTAGLHHFAVWGGISPDYGQLPSGAKDFVKVFLAQEVGDSIPGVPYNEWANRKGNHLGTMDVALEYRFPGGFIMKAYWQNFIENSTTLRFDNISDGLWGLQVEQPGKIKIGYEFFRSITDKDYMIGSTLDLGVVNYFNNGIYQSGWTYKGYTIGNPLISSPILQNPDYPDYIINNRVVGHIVHGKLMWNKYILNLKYSFTNNYGGSYEIFYPPKEQHSMILSLQTPVLSDKIIGIFSIGYDAGDLFGNHLGFAIGIKRLL